MGISIKVPQMGESVTEGVVAKWLKAPGDAVRADEPVVEIETDKVTVEVPSPADGVLSQQGAPTGTTVAVGDVIGEVTPGAVPQAPIPAPPAPAAAPSSPPAPAPAAMPAARTEAARSGVDLAQVSGSGRGGRILKEDVARTGAASAAAASVRAASGAGREERRPMTPLRRKVAERLLEAQHAAAILTTFNEVDMSAVMAARARWKDDFQARHGVKLGFMSFFVRAAVDALREFPAVNAEIDGTDVVYKYRYDIGVAVGGGKGLVVPVLRDADTKGFAAIEKEIAELGARARANKLSIEDLTGGTFTISNGGVYGSMLSTPILNPPQTGILGLHNIVDRPMAVAGQVVIRPVMYLALSYDHRLVDGREAVQFLVRIKQCIEAPERLLLEV